MAVEDAGRGRRDAGFHDAVEPIAQRCVEDCVRSRAVDAGRTFCQSFDGFVPDDDFDAGQFAGAWGVVARCRETEADERAEEARTAAACGYQCRVPCAVEVNECLEMEHTERGACLAAMARARGACDAGAISECPPYEPARCAPAEPCECP